MHKHKACFQIQSNKLKLVVLSFFEKKEWLMQMNLVFLYFSNYFCFSLRYTYHSLCCITYLVKGLGTEGMSVTVTVHGECLLCNEEIGQGICSVLSFS